jgi:6-phosphogluconolactonase (cycloisomerase 2 family)
MNAGGSGPRRLQLHPNGKFLYVNHETDSKVSVFEVNGASLKQIQTLSTLPAEHKGNNTTAEIQIDQTGKWLYVTNRGHDSIAHYAVDPSKGTLTLVGHTPSGGRTPRNITIDPTNQYLIAANQDWRQHRRVQNRSEDRRPHAHGSHRHSPATRRHVLREGAVARLNRDSYGIWTSLLFVFCDVYSACQRTARE